MTFRNPRPAHVVGVLHLLKVERVPTLLSGRSNTAQGWPVACVVTPDGNQTSAEPIEIRIGILQVDAFLQHFDSLEGQVVSIDGTRWSRSGENPTHPHLIDVMFDPVIQLP
jgi:hypothetical protein